MLLKLPRTLGEDVECDLSGGFLTADRLLEFSCQQSDDILLRS